MKKFRKEFIVGPAIKTKDGEVFSEVAPVRHREVLDQMNFAGVSTTIEQIQGFITSQGNFLDRREAMKLAKENGQLEGNPLPPVGEELYSEDLW